jgi:hypothetical protein
MRKEAGMSRKEEGPEVWPKETPLGATVPDPGVARLKRGEIRAQLDTTISMVFSVAPANPEREEALRLLRKARTLAVAACGTGGE